MIPDEESRGEGNDLGDLILPLTLRPGYSHVITVRTLLLSDRDKLGLR